MKRTCLLIVAMLMLLALPISVYAEDDVARYNFASAQGDNELRISPGEEGRGVIYFYNIDGNRITHITIAVSLAPSGWDTWGDEAIGSQIVLMRDGAAARPPLVGGEQFVRMEDSSAA